jgi:hypothetical protein
VLPLKSAFVFESARTSTFAVFHDLAFKGCCGAGKKKFDSEEDEGTGFIAEKKRAAFDGRDPSDVRAERSEKKCDEYAQFEMYLLYESGSLEIGPCAINVLPDLKN